MITEQTSLALVEHATLLTWNPSTHLGCTILETPKKGRYTHSFAAPHYQTSPFPWITKRHPWQVALNRGVHHYRVLPPNLNFRTHAHVAPAATTSTKIVYKNNTLTVGEIIINTDLTLTRGMYKYYRLVRNVCYKQKGVCVYAHVCVHAIKLSYLKRYYHKFITETCKTQMYAKLSYEMKVEIIIRNVEWKTSNIHSSSIPYE